MGGRSTVSRDGWIFSKTTDFVVFSGPILLGLMLLAVLSYYGVADDLHAPWWVLGICLALVDVPHVYSSVLRTYADRDQRKSNRVLFTVVPLACALAGMMIYMLSSDLFWSLLAYAAMIHFIRQQYGWMALTRYKAGEKKRGLWMDKLMIYNCMLVPVIWWHARPGVMGWFEQGDLFAVMPFAIARYAVIIHWIINGIFLGSILIKKRGGQKINWAKIQIMVVTWIAWYVPIVALDASSYVVGATMQMLYHGIPYMYLIIAYGKKRAATTNHRLSFFVQGKGILVFYALLVMAAAIEKGLWAVFGIGYFKDLSPMIGGSIILSIAIPILAVPQLTHYVLDAFIWKPSRDPRLAKDLGIHQ